MAQKYKLKEGAGRHRLKRTQNQIDRDEPGTAIEPGQVFEPTAEELKAFGHKFERVDGVKAKAE